MEAEQKMKTLRKLQLSRRVVPVGQPVELAFRANFAHAAMTPPERIVLQVTPDDGRRVDGTRMGWSPAQETIPAVVDAQGVAHVTFTFPREQGYSFRVARNDGGEPAALRTLGEVTVYAVAGDLLALRPFAGDLHMHSTSSDGSQPGVCMAGLGRMKGLDFLALTDHRAYQPSLDLSAAVEASGSDLRCFPGEEVHDAYGVVHVVNFGGREAVSPLLTDRNSLAWPEIRELEKQFSELDPDSRSAAAITCWTCRRIESIGGLSVYTHPFWKPYNRFWFPPEAHRAVMRARPFSAWEGLTVYESYPDAYSYSFAEYARAAEGGNPPPVVGVTDSHSGEQESFGGSLTLVFAGSCGYADIADAIRQGRCVAVNRIINPNIPFIMGTPRLVAYAAWLLREYFPQHDDICRAEGEQLLAHFAGDAAASARLQTMRGGVAALQRAFF